MADDPAAEILSAWRTVIDDVNGLATERTPISMAVPRLLKAVEAALKHHRRVPLYGNASTEDKPGSCPHDPEQDWDCHFEDPDSGEWLCEKVTAGAVCSCTESPDGERLPWPCDEVADVLAALTGKEGGDGG